MFPTEPAVGDQFVLGRSRFHNPIPPLSKRFLLRAVGYLASRNYLAGCRTEQLTHERDAARQLDATYDAAAIAAQADAIATAYLAELYDLAAD